MAEDTKGDTNLYTGDPQEVSLHKGLANHGATCYMNSLLQSMFMTKEFRKALYEWKFDDTVQNKEDSIPYQLQKIFARLQLVDDAATTTDLIKSFGWDQNASFEQNDISEFCRVLFEALNTTFEGTPQASLLDNLYNGIYSDTLHCTACGYDSNKEVNFNDISLTIKDDFSNSFNDSLEKALGHYLGTEKLEGDNQYFCSRCDKKVDATKGFKLVKLPKILCLNFKRFTLDYTTFQRVKINDKVTFPLLLNMNPFLREYSSEEVEKLIEDNPLSKVRPSDLRLGKFVRDDEDDKDGQEISNDTSKRYNQFMENELKNLEDRGEMQVEGQTTISRHKEKEQTDKQHQAYLKKMKKNIKKRGGRFNRKNLNSNFFANSKKKPNEAKGWAFDFSIQESAHLVEKPKNAVCLPGEEEKLVEERKKQADEKAQNPQEEQPNESKETKEDTKENEKEEKKIDRKSKDEWADIVTQKNLELADEYKKEGDFVYELFAILIHSGGAHAGHYYTYIKDFETGDWYKFNDVMVHKISFLEIITTFGQKPSKKRRYSSSIQARSNAYMLMYRQIDPDTNVNSVPKSLISQELKDEVEADLKKEKKQLEEKERKDNQMQLKVAFNGDSRVFWVNRKEDTLQSLLVQAVTEFGLEDLGIENCRLRAFNVVNDVMQETYTGKEQETFEVLHIFPLKTLGLETKTAEEEFQEIDPNKITLKVNAWRRNISILDDDNLMPQKIIVNKEETMEDLMNKISTEYNIAFDKLRISKRRAGSVGKNVEELSIEKNIKRKLKILRINDGLTIFIEDKSFEHPDIDKYPFLSKEIAANKWETEFELNRNRSVIKFNIPSESIDQDVDNDSKDKKDPSIEYGKSVVVDKRLTVFDLKVEVSKQLGIGLDKLIFRRGIHGTEIKENDLTLKQASIYNGMCLYIRTGIPSCENEKRLKFFLSEPISEKEKEDMDIATSDSLYYKMRELIEIPVNTHQTTYKVKEFACQKIKESCDIELDPTQIRFRERANDRLTKYYRDEVVIEQYRMYEGKQIAIQSLPAQEVIDQDDIIIMIRSWNPETWQITPMKELVVKRYSTLDEFSHILAKEYPDIQRENMECCKIMSYFFRVQLPYEKWYGLANQEDFLASNPFYLSTDGLLLFVKDKTLVERELTEEEKKEYGCQEYENAIFVTSSKGKRGVFKEKAMKINVKKKKKDPFADALIGMEDSKEDLGPLKAHSTGSTTGLEREFSSTKDTFCSTASSSGSKFLSDVKVQGESENPESPTTEKIEDS
ncbi:unnamed protein product [Moneuplotes crassus]|uniref:Ubiquitin carboxyl-terminal hydrolase 47 n=1 Tax=Euplotes crassus TaxID=5936 RepID=A0AAD1XEE3_EUPCR|nr:unnamed protein product [Moneuplotes crassus]